MTPGLGVEPGPQNEESLLSRSDSFMPFRGMKRLVGDVFVGNQTEALPINGVVCLSQFNKYP